MRQFIALDISMPWARKMVRAGGWDGLVVGSEFCARMLPSPGELASALGPYSGPLVLATPVLPQKDLEAVAALLRAFAGRPGGLEVVANDLGLLEVLRSRYAGKVAVSCGRLLAHRVKIMPRAYAAGFLARYGISSFELDDEALLGRLKPYGLPFSWHYPYRYATVTRFCPWERHWAAGCSHSCRGRAEPLKSVRVSRTLWLKEAAYFVKGQRPRAWAGRNVYTPPPGGPGGGPLRRGGPGPARREGPLYVRERGGRRLLLEALEINAVARCNLSCVACTRSAPAAAPFFADPEEVFRDLRDLSSVVTAKTVRVNGGEPLLHPRLAGLLDAIRRSGITGCVKVFTNGTLLDPSRADWVAQADEIQVSSYPSAPVTPGQIRWLDRLCRESGKGLEVRDIQSFRKWVPEKPPGAEDAQAVFETCQSAHSFSCHTVHRGRVYMCLQSLAAGGGSGETCPIRPLGTLAARLERFLLRRKPLKICGNCLGSCGDLVPHAQATGRDWRRLSSGGTLDRRRLEELRRDPWRELRNYRLRLSVPWAGSAVLKKLPGMNWKKFWSAARGSGGRG